MTALLPDTPQFTRFLNDLFKENILVRPNGLNDESEKKDVDYNVLEGISDLKANLKFQK